MRNCAPGHYVVQNCVEQRIGTMNRKRSVVGQPSRLSSRASRPRRILGRDAPAAGGTPALLPRGSWKGFLTGLLTGFRTHWSRLAAKARAALKEPRQRAV